MKKDAASMVKHSENEKSATKTTKKHRNIYFSYLRCSIFIVFSQSICLRPDTLPCVLGNGSYRVMFFDFLIPLSSKTPIFESFFGRWPARNALKTRCFS